MREPAWIERVAQALRAVHRGPSLPARFNSFRVVEDYRTTAFARGAEVPPSYAWARQVARRVERARGAFAERPCHNDLLNANFIDDGGASGSSTGSTRGWATSSSTSRTSRSTTGSTATRREALLEAYFGEVRPSNERALELMLFMSDFREAMWGVVQGAMSELDFDFGGYAAEHFERMEVDRRVAGVRRRARVRLSAPSAAVPEHGRRRRGLGREADQRDRS